MRNTGNEWKEVSFIHSMALGGNSSLPLSYTFNDNNTNKGITQYRILQVDLDGKSKYSEIRSVRGVSQKGKIIIYPNPSSNGTVNIVLDEKQEARNISLSDMNGRILRHWNKVITNSFQVTNLNPGMYIVHVMSLETGITTMEKIVIAK
jgi:hypothetical protein